MKIAVLSSSAPYGRGESFVVSEVNAIARHGVEVLLVPTILRKGTPNNFSFDNNVRILKSRFLSFPIFIGFFLFLGRKPTEFFKILALARDKSIVNTIKNFVVVPKSIWLAKKLSHENVNHIHAHWLTTSSTLALIVSRISGIPWSATGHRGDIVANNILEKKFSFATFVRFISKSGANLGQSLSYLDEKKCVVLHMGVSVNDDMLDSRKSVPSRDAVKILCPANLIAVKGHEYLIEAFSKLSGSQSVILELAGEGDRKWELEKLVKRWGVEDRVFFRGHVPHQELLSRYRTGDVDVVVLPSRDLGSGVHEGIPVSLMEAMAQGIPVVSTKTGGIPELLTDDTGKRYGILVEADNVAELAEALDQLVSCPEERVRLGMLGFKRVLSDFNEDLTAKKLIKLIREQQV